VREYLYESALWREGLCLCARTGEGSKIQDVNAQRTPVLLPFCKRGRETSTVSNATRAKRAVRMILPLYWRCIEPCVRVCFHGQKQIAMNKGDKVRSTIEANSDDIPSKGDGSDKLISFCYNGMLIVIGIKQLIKEGLPHGGMITILKS
jgi:hypothetical protein